MRYKLCGCCAWLALGAAFFPLLSSAQALSAPAEMRRFALVVGANHGGRDRSPLVYAVSDARAMAKILNQIGGVAPEDSLLLEEPSRAALLEALNRMRSQLAGAQFRAKKIEMIFYYSGHSDEEALLLNNQKVFYTEIGSLVKVLPADVRIAILDSCSSGAFTRIKGGRTRPPFLQDTAYDMKGYAFMTSSSPDEASQESDKIKGSFFTHYLISGLRGAADLSQDGRVTLNEAYQFAYHETLARTEKTTAGPQHPNYDIRMSGTGDVVMTDVRKSSAMLTLSPALSGRIFIRDAQGSLAVELRKYPGREVLLGLEEGPYAVINERDGRLYQAEITLEAARQATLAPGQLQLMSKEQTASRGADSPGNTPDGIRELSAGTHAGPRSYQKVPAYFSLAPGPETPVIANAAFGLAGSSMAGVDGCSLNLGLGVVAGDVRGLQLSLIGNKADGGVQGAQVAGVFNRAGSAEGAQVAGIFNLAGTNLALQAGGIFNATETDANGAQVAGIFNRTGGHVRGLQGAGIFNFSGADMKDLQVAGIFNRSEGSMEGLQAAGVFNYARRGMKYFQTAGVGNFTDGPLQGCQAAGLCNYVRDEVAGLQLSGLCNLGLGSLAGVQAAPVNYARKAGGVQLGLVNVAEEQSGVPVGLVNVADNGGVEVLAWSDNASPINTGFKIRAGNMYSLFAVGGDRLDSESGRRLSFGFYYGGRLPIQPLFLDMDLGVLYLDHQPVFTGQHADQISWQGRVLLNYAWLPRLALLAGGGVKAVYPLEHGAAHLGEYAPLYVAGISYSF